MAITSVPACIFCKAASPVSNEFGVLIYARNIFFIRQLGRSQTTLDTGTGPRQPAG